MAVVVVVDCALLRYHNVASFDTYKEIEGNFEEIVIGGKVF